MDTDPATAEPAPTSRGTVRPAGGGAASRAFGALPRLDGELVRDPCSTARAADDYGHLVRHRPLGVLRAASASDIAAVLRWCAEHGIPAAARGQGHTTYGQAQVEGGMVLDTAALRGVRWESASRVAVQAGARWSDVLRATLRRGRAPRVLTDYLGLSVGGTLSVGGFGGASQHYGAQTDNVAEIEVVTGNGRIATCSPDQDPELFHAALAGLGQCAVITRASVETVPVPPSVRRFALSYPTASALAHDQRRLVADGRFAHVEGLARPAPDGGGWRYVLEAVAMPPARERPDDAALLGDLHDDREQAEIGDLPFLEFADRMAPGIRGLRLTGQWYHPHPWLNLLLPDSAADDVVGTVMAGLTPDAIGPSGVVLLYPMRRAVLRTPLLRVPDEPVVFLFALLRTATPAPGAPTAEEALDANRRSYELARERGGVRYPVGSVAMGPGDWPAHFGERWPDLVAAKAAYDPASILAPGVGVFPAPPR
ncbi:FAD/FMN-containing dehydrogenase [Lipingzhangella halophila]|uniref:FAD/FMN-containing dehydrogenase n=1 Tax=Lipingzhangella halophila TaxID=1783352 RepID=A0A7W7W3G9_9ACTN|nr:FAD-binding protein [Lipingzhangella halophila]MBB4933042.1 FAD/FMN-containing dehydrogenase [Lipingzhangella halophila]